MTGRDVEPYVSVVIATRDRAAFLEGALESLRAQVRAPAFEVVVADNGSRDGTAELVARYAARGGMAVRYAFVERPNRGAARNAGIAVARGAIVAFVDDDVIVPPGFLAAHAAAHAGTFPHAVSGPILNVPSRDVRPKPGPANYSRAFFCTCNVSVPRSSLVAAGNFDERFDLYGWEDTELGLRLRRRDVRRKFAWDAYLWHLKPAQTETFEVLLTKVTERAQMAAHLLHKDGSWRTRLATGAYGLNLARAAIVAPAWSFAFLKRLQADPRVPAGLRAFARAQALDVRVHLDVATRTRASDRAGRSMKILIVRCDGVGDALVCAPLVAALRDAGHELGIVLGVGNRDIFAKRTFARVHVLERIPWPAHGSTPKTRAKALADVRAIGYDLALIASEEVEAYAFAKDAKIPRRVGFVNGWDKPLKTLQVRMMLTQSIVRPATEKDSSEHEVRTIFKLGAGLHDEAGPTRDAARLRELVLDEPVPKTPYIMMQTSVKNEHAGLDRETYIALARALRQSRCEVILLGDEVSIVNVVAKASGAMADALLSTVEWKERIASARALITPDSGAAHVAGMIGLPTIDCFAGGPSAQANIKRWSPWAAPHRALVLASAPPEFMAGALVGELYDLLASLKR